MTRSLRSALVILVGGVTVLSAYVGITPSPAAVVGCPGSTSAHGGKGIVVKSHRRCDRTGEGDGSGKGARTSEWPKTTLIDCGPPKVVPGIGGVAPKGTNCAFARTVCSVPDAKQQPKDPHLTTTLTLMQRRAGEPWIVSNWNCHATTAKPQLTPWMVRDEMVKLVKPVAIASAPPPPKAVLVNVQWVAWIPTPSDRSLGTVRMLDTYDVSLRIHLDHVDWDYGDGSKDVTNDPGKAYDPERACHTRLCPEYLGHVYTKDGHYTATATLTWAGQFSVDGGVWQDIPGAVTVNGPGLPVAIVQARSELIPDGSPS